MAEIQHRCPQCGRLLVFSETGRIGKCPHHQIWYAVAEGAEGEAGQKNAEESRKKELQRVAEREAIKRAEQEKIRKRRASILRKVLLLLATIIALIMLIVLFVVRPGMSYDEANALLYEGKYAQAKDGYLELGSYKDAADRVMLCDAMLDLDEGNTLDAMSKLDVLVSQRDSASVNMLREAFLSMMENWKTYGISPEIMLELLQRRDAIDINGSLDYERLNHEIHVALLDTNVRSMITADVDADSEAELMVLGNDFSLNAYDMLPTGNERVLLDTDTSALYLITFGDGLLESSVEDALGCYLAAYHDEQNETTKRKVALAYHTRAMQSELAGDRVAALSDAKQAVSFSGAMEDFDFYYNMVLRSCADEKDQSVGIERWQNFSAEEGALIQQFAAKGRSDKDAGRLRMQYAVTLAAEHDDRCIDLFREARSLGADIHASLLDAIAQQTPGLLLAELRVEAIDLFQESPDRQNEHRALLASEIASALSDWENMCLQGEEVLRLIRFADAHAVQLNAEVRTSAYEAAAVDAANAKNAIQNLFVNWDGDTYTELLTIDHAGVLKYYVFKEALHMAFQYDTGLRSPSMTLFECDKPLLLVTSDIRDSFTVISYADGAISPVIREEEIVHYSLDGNMVTFDRMMAGSIERCEQYSYTIDSSVARAVLTGTNWQKEQYPYPVTAQQTLLRWLEAHTYAIRPEEDLLEADTEYAGLGFLLASMKALPTPDGVEEISLSAYDVQEKRVLFEAVYTSAGKKIRTYFAVTQKNEKWKVAGSADCFTSALKEVADDPAVPLLTLNETHKDKLDKKGDIDNYRILLPQSAEVSLLWQAGSSDKNRTAFGVTLYNSEDMTKPIIRYDLALSANKQMSNPLFLAPGVYYASVEAVNFEDVPYNLSLRATPDPYIESESNDTMAEANPIKPNRAYRGSLKDSKDVDCYVVTLDEPGLTKVTIEGSREEQRSARYHIAMADASGAMLTSLQMAGNAKTAKSCNLYLAPGSYVVQVAKGSYTSTAAYQIIVEHEPLAVSEQESNGTPETANSISVNESVVGSFGVEGDKDYFTFTLEHDSVIQPKLTFAPLETSSRAYTLSIQDRTQTLLNANIGGKESQKIIPPLALPAGTYIVKLENPRFTQQDYALFITAVDTASAEKEPNDALAQANELQLASSMTGVISNEEDVDLYKITLLEETTATLCFRFPASVVDGTV